jgi:hypothetical protein
MCRPDSSHKKIYLAKAVPLQLPFLIKKAEEKGNEPDSCSGELDG